MEYIPIRTPCAKIPQLHGGDCPVERCEGQSLCMLNGFRFVHATIACDEARTVDFDTFSSDYG